MLSKSRGPLRTAGIGREHKGIWGDPIKDSVGDCVEKLPFPSFRPFASASASPWRPCVSESVGVGVCAG